jgi:hypothetical protein
MKLAASCRLSWVLVSSQVNVVKLVSELRKILDFYEVLCHEGSQTLVEAA